MHIKKGNGSRFHKILKNILLLCVCILFCGMLVSSDVNAAAHSYGAAGLTLVGFQVEADAKNHVDVLYSERSYNKVKAAADNVNTPYDEVDIDFLHALSLLIQSECSDLGVFLLLLFRLCG